MTNAIIPTGWFHYLYFHSQNETDSRLSYRLGTAFLLDGGVSISVPGIPTYMKVTQRFIACNHDQHDASNNLTIAEAAEVLI